MVFNKTSVYLYVLILLVTTPAVSQVAPPSRTPRTTVDPNRQDTASRRWYEELQKRENSPTGIGSLTETKETLIANLRKEALKKLSPTEEDKKEFAEFLTQPKTGLLKLAAETDCTRILDVAKPDKECLNFYLPGKARAYSFRKHIYSHPAFADFERSKQMFVLSGTYILGMMALMDNESIGTITLQNEDVSRLLEFMPASDINNVVRQEKEITNGLLLGKLTYRKVLPIKENSTYLLRSVAYRAKFENLPKSGSREDLLNKDERSDIIIVFRVVRRYLDDTCLLLWKEIYRKDSPKLEVDMANAKNP